jgi:hypothetical protein
MRRRRRHMTTRRKHLCTGLRGGLFVAMMIASLWVAPASDANEHDESAIGEELSERCGYYTEGGHAYYSNCDTFIGHWIEWYVHAVEADTYQTACVPPSTTLPLGPADEVEFVISVGISRKFFPAQGAQRPDAWNEQKRGRPREALGAARQPVQLAGSYDAIKATRSGSPVPTTGAEAATRAPSQWGQRTRSDNKEVDSG